MTSVEQRMELARARLPKNLKPEHQQSKSNQTSYSRAELIDALIGEWDYLSHEEPPEDGEREEFIESLHELTHEQLVTEAGVDEFFTLDEFMETYG
jgi:hypothetical protein